MVRLLFVPASMGVLLALFIYFLLPQMVSGADIVAYFARTALELSNALFAHMPQRMADYIASLNLLAVAITAGILLTVIIQILVLVASGLAMFLKAILYLLKSNQKPPEPRELEPLELDARYRGTPKGKDIAGRNFDSIERD